VRGVAPLATGTPVGLVGAGEAVSQAFFKAFLIAIIANVLFLFWVTRRTGEVLLTLMPLLVSLGLTASATVLLRIPFNFANIIVVPLLLGIGLDYAVHLVYRFRADQTARRNILQTSTAHGVLVSALTTIGSFCSLSFSAHKGTASMGIMLAVCIGLMIACTLVLLPVLLHLFAHMLLNPQRQSSLEGR
jgi:predicted RND superfamily exporter protein